MERILARTYKWKERFLIQDLMVLIYAIMVGLIKDPYAIPFIMTLLSYVYIRNKHESILVLIGFLLASLYKGWVYFYIYALMFSLFFVVAQVINLWNRNRIKLIPWICIILSIPYLLYLGTDNNSSFVIFAYLTLNISSFIGDSYWVERKLVIHKSFYAVLINAIALLIINYNPNLDYNLIFRCSLFLSALIATPKDIVLSSLFLYLLFPNIIEPCWIVLFMLISLYQKQRLIQMLCCGGILFFIKVDAISVLYSGSFAFLCLIYKEKYVPYLMLDQENENDSQLLREDLNLKLSNFSSIFDSLSKYYESFSNIEADMLKEMSTALNYTSDELKKYSIYDNLKEKVIKALEGYQYDVDHFLIQQNRQGDIYIELNISNIKRSEISTTLIPLLEVILHCHFEVDEIKARKLKQCYHFIKLHSAPAFLVDAYGDSLKNMYERSGDCFSIFRFRQNVVCMISDGMGNGEKAATSSRIITNIFQRMIASGIMQDSAIRCINKLLQSDAYATLDVISFDRMRGLAYISKSAACPTFLIRDNQLYEVNGSSLPVGIVKSIEPDCFTIKIEEGDAYLMISDGIYMDEIYQWLKKRSALDARYQVEEMIQILSSNDRKDDSTLLLAIVSKY